MVYTQVRVVFGLRRHGWCVVYTQAWVVFGHVYFYLKVVNVLFGNKDYTSVLYSVVIRRYTQLYTSVILGSLYAHLRPNTQCYTEAYIVWITEEYTCYTIQYSITMPLTLRKQLITIY